MLLEFDFPVTYSAPFNSQSYCRKYGEANLVEGAPLVLEMLVPWEYAPDKDEESVPWNQTVWIQIFTVPLLAV